MITGIEKAAKSLREFSPEEQSEIAEGESQWLPRIFKTYSDKPSVDLASPGKLALVAGLAGAIPGAAIGGLLGHKDSPEMTIPGALLGGAVTGVPIGLLAYLARGSENENIKNLIRRMPKGATRYELEGDPVWRARMQRDAMMAAGAVAANG